MQQRRAVRPRPSGQRGIRGALVEQALHFAADLHHLVNPVAPSGP